MKDDIFYLTEVQLWDSMNRNVSNTYINTEAPQNVPNV